MTDGINPFSVGSATSHIFLIMLLWVIVFSQNTAKCWAFIFISRVLMPSDTVWIVTLNWFCFALIFLLLSPIWFSTDSSPSNFNLYHPRWLKPSYARHYCNNPAKDETERCCKLVVCTMNQTYEIHAFFFWNSISMGPTEFVYSSSQSKSIWSTRKHISNPCQ